MLPSGITELLFVAVYEAEILNNTKKNVFDYYEAKIHKILKACKYQNVLLLSFTCRKTRLTKCLLAWAMQTSSSAMEM